MHQTMTSIDMPAARSGASSLHACEQGRAAHRAGRTASVPSFEDLLRCDWGTHVTACGQPARFNQAGSVGGRNIVVILASIANAELRSRALYCEPAGAGEGAFYLDYEAAEVRVGTSSRAALMGEQATSCLRRGDIILVKGVSAVFLAAGFRGDAQYIFIRTSPAQEPALSKLGAEAVDDRVAGRSWRLELEEPLQLRLVSARIPTFDEIRCLTAGTGVTLGPAGEPARLLGCRLVDGTRQFVVVGARAGLALHQVECHPIPDGDWSYRIRFQQAGLRLVEGGVDGRRRSPNCVRDRGGAHSCV